MDESRLASVGCRYVNDRMNLGWLLPCPSFDQSRSVVCWYVHSQLPRSVVGVSSVSCLGRLLVYPSFDQTRLPVYDSMNLSCLGRLVVRLSFGQSQLPRSVGGSFGQCQSSIPWSVSSGLVRGCCQSESAGIRSENICNSVLLGP